MNHNREGLPLLPLIYCLRDALLMPSFWAALDMVSPEPSNRDPRRDDIARSSQISGVREEEDVTCGFELKDGNGVSPRSG